MKPYICKPCISIALSLIIISSNIFLPNLLRATDYTYFESPVSQNTCSLIVNHLNGELILSQESQISYLSPVTFNLSGYTSTLTYPAQSLISQSGSLIFSCVNHTNLYPMQDIEYMAMINANDLSLEGYIELDRYPLNMDFNESENLLYISAGISQNQTCKIYKVDTSSKYVLDENECGRDPMLTLTHDMSKVYVLDGQAHYPEIVDYSEEGPIWDFGDEYSLVWVYDAYDLDLLTKVHINSGAVYLVRGEQDQIIVGHNPPFFDGDVSITILDSYADMIEREIYLEDIGFATMEFDSSDCNLYGSLTLCIPTSDDPQVESVHHYENTNKVVQIDIYSEEIVATYTMGPETVATIALSPDKNRIYAKSTESAKIWYLDKV